ncbi:hypothetical protein CPB84DRAFT_1340448 [Gymnopilus junonius]|uniref:Uncharacterized protein n=1 Tax=Gymnopilus junonius TaxID=109634 RepID=A0A9P5NHL7_GYMJU|nr:hypothetical protein CPB84DRAFT_1340448 [Gymnopilus junonius]
MPADIPLEVMELIVDEVASRNDKETLRNVALSSRHFVDRCQQKLFHTIDLGDRCISGEEYYRRFFYTMYRQPLLRPYVRDLRLVDTYVWDKNGDAAWIATEDSICDLLDILPNIHAFSLTFNIGQPSWTSFTPHLRHSFMQVAQRPRLLSYSLKQIRDFPPTLLVALATIKRLELHDIKVQNLHLTSSLGIILNLPSIPTPKLESLVLKAPSKNTVHALRTLLSAYSGSTLRTLKLGLVDEKDQELLSEIWGLMHWASKTLAHLEWRPGIRPKIPAMRPPPPINISIFPRLSSLHFLVNFHSESQPVFSALLDLLSEVSSGYHFQELVIECMFLKTVELVACSSDWSALDTMLLKSEFSGLKAVVFCARLRSAQFLKDSAKTILMEQLPLVRSRGAVIAFDWDFS